MADDPNPKPDETPKPAEPLPPNVPMPPDIEIGGRGGLEPTRYGDWEKGGIAVDF
jgi:hypothetical protein